MPGDQYNRWYHKDDLVCEKSDRGDKGKGKSKDRKRDGKGKEGKGKDGKGKSKGKGKQTTEYVESTGPVRADGGYRLNVKNLSSSYNTNDKLLSLFKPYGFVYDYDVRTHEDGSSKGFGYVVMKNEAQAKKAMEGLDGKLFDGKALEVVPAERRVGGKGSTEGTAVDLKEQLEAISYMTYVTALQQTFMEHAYMQAWAGALGFDQALDDSLELMSEKHGHDFDACMGTQELYQGDEYCDNSILPEGAARQKGDAGGDAYEI
eukprot:TRINITY_DN64531_c0_g1_i1.p1 TRINITY_DN64531_c0_g1~~TRINITY_DN64531_c0_g1_i1.p1  ORF type:complete len:261 (+),score=57.21 TRINITY_DN64531_c0_g1_i1:215-997(+)